jgi:hypothetical protein
MTKRKKPSAKTTKAKKPAAISKTFAGSRAAADAGRARHRATARAAGALRGVGMKPGMMNWQPPRFVKRHLVVTFVTPDREHTVGQDLDIGVLASVLRLRGNRAVLEHPHGGMAAGAHLLAIWKRVGWRKRAAVIRLMRRYPTGAAHIITTGGISAIGVGWPKGEMPEGLENNGRGVASQMRALDWQEVGGNA